MSTASQPTLTTSSLSKRSVSSVGSDTSLTVSIESFISYSKAPRGFSVRYTWTSKWDLIVFQLASFITMETFFIIPMDVFTDEPTTILHYVIFYAVCAVPLVYMQIIVGQYSQLGVIFFKYLTPIGHGIGFALCINSLWSCIVRGVFMGDFTLYFLSAMKSELPWMSCPENHAKCWVTSNNCTSNCFTPEKELSTFVFWREVYMRNVELETTTFEYTAPILPRVVVVGMAWALVYTVTRSKINKYKKLININMLVVAILFFLLLFVSILAQGGSKGLELFTNFEWKTLFKIKSWTSVVLNGLKLLGSTRACYVVYGTYMDSATPSNLLTILFVCIHLFWMLFGCVLIFAAIGIISARSHTPVTDLYHIFYGPVPQLILLPQSLGYLGAPQLWSSIYFLICFLLLLNHQVVHIDVVERCITDLNPRFKPYSNYTLGALCLVSLIFGIVLVSTSTFVVQYVLYHLVVIPVEALEVALMCTLIGWVYGVQSFSDDIHFMVGTQPAKYWKICWYALPAVLWMCSLHVIYNLKLKQLFRVTAFIFCVIYISPMPIMGVIAIFHHLKRHNLIGVIQAQERWGPPDPRERHLRHLFNPREETRSRRRNESCKHKCLMRSKILNQAIEEQENLRMEDNYEVVKVEDGSNDGSESDEG